MFCLTVPWPFLVQPFQTNYDMYFRKNPTRVAFLAKFPFTGQHPSRDQNQSVERIPLQCTCCEYSISVQYCTENMPFNFSPTFLPLHAPYTLRSKCRQQPDHSPLILGGLLWMFYRYFRRLVYAAEAAVLTFSFVTTPIAATWATLKSSGLSYSSRSSQKHNARGVCSIIVGEVPFHTKS